MGLFQKEKSKEAAGYNDEDHNQVRKKIWKGFP
jgi:hypothetical protein